MRHSRGSTIAGGLPTPDAILDQVPGENFPVAPVFLPRAVRRHLLAIYGFARLVDDVGDEAAGDRRRLLDAVERDLEPIWRGGAPGHPIIKALVPTVHALDLPAEPFRRLIAANRQDQVVRRYQRFEDLLAYCELSANPVGHLVLQVFGVATPERRSLADRVCTALQLVEHCQDVAEDLARDRIYLPLEDLARFGCHESDLAQAPASRRVRRLLAFQVDRIAALLDAGAPLVGSLTGRARLATAGFVGGGRAALTAIRAADHDVLTATPKPSRLGVASESLAVAMRGR
jgi:squalene synthase HpnC